MSTTCACSNARHLPWLFLLMENKTDDVAETRMVHTQAHAHKAGHK